MSPIISMLIAAIIVAPITWKIAVATIKKVTRVRSEAQRKNPEK